MGVLVWVNTFIDNQERQYYSHSTADSYINTLSADNCRHSIVATEIRDIVAHLYFDRTYHMVDLLTLTSSSTRYDSI
jgi:hypothetical protein